MASRFTSLWLFNDFSQIRFIFLFLLAGLQGCATLPWKGVDQPLLDMPRKAIPQAEVALVLGGGGAKGLAHVGVIEVLKKEGIEPDLIVGCSAGAIVGALYADQPQVPRLKDLLLEMKRENLLKMSLASLPFGLSDGGELRAFLNEHLKAKRFEDLKIRLAVVATGLDSGDLVTFATGPIEPAVRASAAFPGVFSPVEIQARPFVDGGVANPVPVEVARTLGAQFVIAVDLSSSLTDNIPNHLLGVMKRSLEISYLHQSRMAHAQADVVIKIPTKDVGTFDDTANGYLYELGRTTAYRMLPILRRKLAQFRAKLGQEPPR
ncbi:MAG: patatin-like phospholipase family protein [Holosporales bacterium]